MPRIRKVATENHAAAHHTRQRRSLKMPVETIGSGEDSDRWQATQERFWSLRRCRGGGEQPHFNLSLGDLR